MELKECNIMMGSQATIKISEECEFLQSRINVGKHAKALVGTNVWVSDNNWTLKEKAHMKIGSRGILCSGRLFQEQDSCIKIGGDFSVGRDYNIVVSRSSMIEIGNDCMFSFNIEMRSNDGHSIFDVITGKNINSTYDICKRRKIVIGAHVWVGMHAIILYNAEIRSGSIIGAASLVKGVIPNNCIAAGVPAKVIRKNVAWSRENCAENIEKCGESYVRLTGK